MAFTLSSDMESSKMDSSTLPIEEFSTPQEASTMDFRYTNGIWDHIQIQCRVSTSLLMVCSLISLIIGIPKVKEGILVMKTQYRWEHILMDVPSVSLLTMCATGCGVLCPFNIVLLLIGTHYGDLNRGLSYCHWYLWMATHVLTAIATTCVAVDRFYHTRNSFSKSSRTRQVVKKHYWLFGPIPGIIALVALSIAFTIDIVQEQLDFLEVSFFCVSSGIGDLSVINISRWVEAVIVLACMIITAVIYTLCICEVRLLTRKTEPSVEGQIVGDQFPMHLQNAESRLGRFPFPRGSNAFSSSSHVPSRARYLSSNDTVTNHMLEVREAWGLDKAIKVLGVDEPPSRPISAFSRRRSSLFGLRKLTERMPSLNSENSTRPPSRSEAYRPNRASTVGSCVAKEIVSARMSAVEKLKRARESQDAAACSTSNQQDVPSLLKPLKHTRRFPGGSAISRPSLDSIEIPGFVRDQQWSDSGNSSTTARSNRSSRHRSSPFSTRMYSIRDSDSEVFDQSPRTVEISCQTDPEPADENIPASPVAGPSWEDNGGEIPTSDHEANPEKPAPTVIEPEGEEEGKDQFCAPTAAILERDNEQPQNKTQESKKWSITAEPSHHRFSREGPCSPADITFSNMEATNGSTSQDSGQHSAGDKTDKCSPEEENNEQKQEVCSDNKEIKVKRSKSHELYRAPFIPREPTILDNVRQRSSSKENDFMAFYRKLPRRGTMTDLADSTPLRENLVRRDSFPPTSQPARPAIRVMKASVDTEVSNNISIHPNLLNSRRIRGGEFAFSDISGSVSTNNSRGDSISLPYKPEVCFSDNNRASSMFNSRTRSPFNRISRLASRDSIYFQPRLPDEAEPQTEAPVFGVILQHSLIKMLTFIAFYLISCLSFFFLLYWTGPGAHYLYIVSETCSILYFPFVLYVYKPNINIDANHLQENQWTRQSANRYTARSRMNSNK